MKDIELPKPGDRATEAGLRDRLAAVEADRAQRVPEGFALVPIEPTQEMLNCAPVPTNEAEKFAADLAAGYRKTIWAAMLASAPAQPAPQPVERKPMTRAQVEEMSAQEEFFLICDDIESLGQIVEAVERHHGIKE